MRKISVALAWLITVSLAFAPVNAVGLGQAAPSDSGGLLANNCADESTPLPARPVLNRSTFSSAAPKPPRHHKPSIKKRTVAKKKTIASKPKKPASPTVAPKPAAKKHLVKKHGKRKTVHKRNVASKMGKKGPALHGNEPLQRATFGSPICQDRAPVMQAFGLGDADQPLGDEFAQAIQDALAPQDTTFTDGNFPGGPSPRPFTFPPTSRIGDGGAPPPENPGGPGPGTPPVTPPDGSGNPPVTPPDGPGTPVTPGNPGNPPAVPEPASWAMMMLGFGLIGFTLRRRHRAVRAA
jgi:hypothetical protein